MKKPLIAALLCLLPAGGALPQGDVAAMDKWLKPKTIFYHVDGAYSGKALVSDSNGGAWADVTDRVAFDDAPRRLEGREDLGRPEVHRHDEERVDLDLYAGRDEAGGLRPARRRIHVETPATHEAQTPAASAHTSASTVNRSPRRSVRAKARNTAAATAAAGGTQAGGERPRRSSGLCLLRPRG